MNIFDLFCRRTSTLNHFKRMVGINYTDILKDKLVRDIPATIRNRGTMWKQTYTFVPPFSGGTWQLSSMWPYMPMDMNSMIKNSIFFTDSSYFEKKKFFPSHKTWKVMFWLKLNCLSLKEWKTFINTLHTCQAVFYLAAVRRRWARLKTMYLRELHL